MDKSCIVQRKWWITFGALCCIAGVAAAQSTSAVTRRLRVETLSGPEQFVPITVAADGRSVGGLALSKGNYNLGIQDLESGVVRQLTSDASAAAGTYADYSSLSLDGKTIAFTWFTNANRANTSVELQVINTDGSQRRTLFKSPAIDYVNPVEWTRDGRGLVVQMYGKDGSQQIAMMDVASGSSRSIRSFNWRGPNTVALSPDGEWLTYDFEPSPKSAARDLYALSTNGEREIRLTSDGAHKRVVGWAPDGSGLYYRTNNIDASTIHFLPMRGGTANGTSRVVRTDVWGLYTTIGVTRDGLFYATTDQRSDAFMLTLDASGKRPLGTPVRIARNAVTLRWSPDGRRLAFAQRDPSPRLTRSTLVLHDVATSEQRSIPLAPQNAGVIRWISPSSIETSGQERNQVNHYEVDLATGQAKHLGLYRYSITMSPDQKTEYVIENKDRPADAGKVIARDVATRSEREIFSGARVWSVTPSTDGKTLALRVGAGFRDAPGDASIILLPAAGGEQRVLYKTNGLIGPQSIDWSRNGRLVFKALANGSEEEELFVADIATGEITKLHSAKGGIFGSRISPDGRRIVYQTQSGSGTLELWRMEKIPGTSR